MRRILWLCASLCVILSGVAAEPPATVQITAQGLPNPTSVDVISIAARAVLKEFTRRYPQYVVRPFVMPTIEGQGQDSAPLMAIAAGIPPHVIFVNFRQSATYIGQGFLEPMEILLARASSDDPRLTTPDGNGGFLSDPSPAQIEATLAMIQERIPKPSWPVVYREDDSGRLQGKHVWCLPSNNQVHALAFRKDLFYDAGLDPDRPPQTWDELLDYCRKLTKPERGQFGIIFTTGKYISYSAYEFLGSNGVEAMRRNDRGEWEAAYGNRAAAEAVYFTWRLCREKWTPPGSDKEVEGVVYTGSGQQRNRDWERGKMAMSFLSIQEEMIAAVNPQLVGLAGIPAPAGRKGAGVINAIMYGVFSGSTPEQKIAAARYVWFLTSKDAQRIRAKAFVEGGYGQYVNPLLLKEFGYERLLKQVPKGWQEVFAEAIENGVPEPYGKNTQNIYDYLDRPIHTSLEKLSTSTTKGGWAELSHEEKLDRIEKELRASAAEVNERVLGKLSPVEQKSRRQHAGIAALVVAVVFTLGMVHVWRHFTRMAVIGQERRHWRKYIWGYALLVPGLVLMVLWAYLPLLGGLGMAFADYQLIRESQWVGLGNFASIIHDPRFWASLWRTVYFVALTIGLGFWPPILLAIMLQEIPTNTAKYVYRTIYYLPAVLSGLVVMFLWKNLYGPTESGVLNKIILSLNMLGPFPATVLKWVLLGSWGALIGLLIWLPIKVDEMPRSLKFLLWGVALVFLAVTVWPLIDAYRQPVNGGWSAVGAGLSNVVGRFGLKPFRWLNSPEAAMVCIVIPTIWAASGPGCILYLAALKTVPDELYEAAEVDGATNWHKVFYIVLPRLKYLIVIQFVGAVQGAFRGGVEYIMAMTGGGPNDATNILAVEIFSRVFMNLQYGEGTAAAWILGALLIGFTAYQLKLLASAEFKAGG